MIKSELTLINLTSPGSIPPPSSNSSISTAAKKGSIKDAILITLSDTSSSDDEDYVDDAEAGSGTANEADASTASDTSDSDQLTSDSENSSSDGDDSDSASELSDWSDVDPTANQHSDQPSTSAAANRKNFASQKSLEADLKSRFYAALKLVNQKKHEMAVTQLENLAAEEVFDRFYLHAAELNEMELSDVSIEKLEQKPESRKEISRSLIDQIYIGLHRNLSELYAKHSHQPLKALRSLLRVLRLEKCDGRLWFEAGLLAVQCRAFTVARVAFENSLLIDAYNVSGVEELLCCLYVLNEYLECGALLNVHLEQCHTNTRLLSDRVCMLRDVLLKKVPWLRTKYEILDKLECHRQFETDVKNKFESCLGRLQKEHILRLNKKEPIKTYLVKPMKQPLSWVSVCHMLLRTYTSLMNSNTRNLGTGVDLSDVLNSVQGQSEPHTSPTKQSTTGDVTNDHNDVIMMDTDVNVNEQPQQIVDDQLVLEQVQAVVNDLVNSVVVESTVVNGSTKGCGRTATNDDSSVSGSSTPLSTPLSPIAVNCRRSARGREKATGPQFSHRKDSSSHRRSSRLVPGFVIEDDYLCAKPLSLSEKLSLYTGQVLDARTIGHTPAADAPTTVNCVVTSSESQCLQSPTQTPLDDVIMMHDDYEMLIGLLRRMNDHSIHSMLDCCLRELVQHTEYKWSAALCACVARVYEVWFTVHEHALHNTHLHLLYVQCCAMFPRKEQREAFELQETVLQSVLLGILLPAIQDLTFEQATQVLWLQYVLQSEHVSTAQEREQKAVLEACADWLLLYATTVHDQYTVQAVQNKVVLLSVCGQYVSAARIERHINKLTRRGSGREAAVLFANAQYELVVNTLQGHLQDERSLPTHQAAQLLDQMLLLCRSHLELRAAEQCIHWMLRTWTLTMHLQLTLDLKEHDAKVYPVLAELMSVLRRLLDTKDMRETLLVDCNVRAVIQLLNKSIVLRMNVPQNRFTSDSCALRPSTGWLCLYDLVKYIEAKLLADPNYLKDMFRTRSSQRVMLANRALMILWTAHEEMGAKRACTADNAQILHALLREMSEAMHDPTVAELCVLTDAKYKPVGDDMLSAAEQCFYCLYAYPNKKRRHLDEHHVSSVQLDWSAVRAMFEFVVPAADAMPAFDGYASDTISADALQLLLRIQPLLPAYIQDNEESILRDCENELRNCETIAQLRLPLIQVPEEDSFVLNHYFHLLADYNFKNSDFELAAKYYQMDLCVATSVEHRFDSLGGLALARQTATMSAFDEKKEESLDGSRLLSETELTLKVFGLALEIEPEHPIVSVECASFAYQLHSCFGRMARQHATPYVLKLKMASRSKRLLQASYEMYSKCLNTQGDKEFWMLHYFTGKCMEKLKMPLDKILASYQASAVAIMDESCRYPDKIRFQSPQKFALEALELHYRVHTVCIKRLLEPQPEDLVDRDAQVDVMYSALRTFREHAFCKQEYEESRCASTGTQLNRLRVDKSVVQVMDDLLDQVSDTPLSHTDKLKCIVQWCLDCMRLCHKRFSSYYKANYRLAYLLSHEQLTNVYDVKQAARVLYGNARNACLSSSLFSQCKLSGWFEGVWRVPLDDLERNGSFSYHMLRSCALCVDVAVRNQDIRMLLTMACAMHRVPDKDKRFVTEPDRVWLCSVAQRQALLVVRAHMDSGDQEGMKQDLFVMVRLMKVLDTLSTAQISWRVIVCAVTRHLLVHSMSEERQKEIPSDRKALAQNWKGVFNWIRKQQGMEDFNAAYEMSQKAAVSHKSHKKRAHGSNQIHKLGVSSAPTNTNKGSAHGQPVMKQARLHVTTANSTTDNANMATSANINRTGLNSSTNIPQSVELQSMCTVTVPTVIPAITVASVNGPIPESGVTVAPSNNSSSQLNNASEEKDNSCSSDVITLN